MKTVYQAIDGTIFQDEQSCKKYETELVPIPKMYGNYGCATTDLYDALVIEIKTDKQIILLRKMARVEDIEEQFEYIEGPCVAIWDGDEHYIELDPNVLRTLTHYIKQEL